MIILDGTVMNVALPNIGKSLNISSISDLQWVTTIYTITNGSLLLLGGRLGDYYGRKRAFLIGLFLFTVSSLIGGFANTQIMLLICRAIQGAAASVLAPTVSLYLSCALTVQLRIKSYEMTIFLMLQIINRIVF